MMRSVLLIGLVGISGLAGTQDPQTPAAASPEGRVKALIDEYDLADRAYRKARGEAKTPQERAALEAHPGGHPEVFAEKLLPLAREFPATKAAEEALIWIASQPVLPPSQEEVRGRLIRDHIRSPRLGMVLENQSRALLSRTAETLLRDAIAGNPDPVVQGQAAFSLAKLYKERARMARSYQKNPDPPNLTGEQKEQLYRSFERNYGPGWRDCLRGDPAALDREAESLFSRVAKQYGDFPHNDRKLAPGLLRDAASTFLREYRDLGVGKRAPEIEAADLEGRPLRLSDYRGKVVVIIFGSHFFCGPCRKLYPSERGLADKYKDRPFALLSIDAGLDGDPLRDREALRKARKEEGLTWGCVWDGAWDGPINRAWNIRMYPTVYVLDRAGVIRHREISTGQLDVAVDRLLTEGAVEKTPRD